MTNLDDAPLFEILEDGECCPAGAACYSYGMRAHCPVVNVRYGNICLLLIMPHVDLSRPWNEFDITADAFSQSIEGLRPLNLAACVQLGELYDIPRP